MKAIKLIGARVKTLGVSVALMGSLFCFSPVTAFAGGPTCICEDKCTEDHVNPDCPICWTEPVSMTVCRITGVMQKTALLSR